MIPNDLYIIKLTCRCVFLNKREVLSRFFGKSNISKYVSTCQTRSNDFWIVNAMCTFMYLFVVYFSFAPVISASIHRYVNYFHIQFLMMVTETETPTSTLHHNIFTYLDFVFSATFILSDFIHIYFHIYIYTYICVCVCVCMCVCMCARAVLQCGKNFQKKTCPGYDTKLHLMVRLHFWRCKQCEVLHYGF